MRGARGLDRSAFGREPAAQAKNGEERVNDAAETWPDGIHRALHELAVRQVAYVPDAGHARLIHLCREDPAMTDIPLTTEEEGIARLAGAWLGGERGVLLMQSSGVGNCVNMLTLPRTCRFPLLALVTMRGEWGELNPWQLPMGQSARDVLDTAGVIVQRLEDPPCGGACRGGRPHGVRGSGPGRAADRAAADRRQILPEVSGSGR
jgi:sulfopyruvate decarboxylase TPP-binding subunit